ncbi:Luminescence regulatory protein LuxO [bacterium HR40]|nr:Luminescence regulatory protein LuxO [bacterium HR40]
MKLEVLLVEDCPEDAALLEAAFAVEPRLRLEIATTRREAMRRLLERPFAALVLDLNLPDSVGLQTLEGIVAAHPNLPIVVLTGFAAGDASLAIEALRLGAQDFVPKSEILRTDWWRVVAFARERKRHERRLFPVGERDPATGLPFAHVLRRRFEEAQRRAWRAGVGLALVALALRGYGQLREEAGADVARRAVGLVATRLRRVVRSTDALAAAPPAGFRLLLEGIRSATDVDRTLARLTAICEQEAVIDDHRLRLRLVDGRAIWQPAQPIPFDLLDAAAERALRQSLGDGDGGADGLRPGDPALRFAHVTALRRADSDTGDNAPI